ncbi:STOREKEEPER protein-like [Tasmannia lanceolata]|uniref:STOREKEEPER protein-like n=1 Tax=Tasmannia lanceolata TaxID=3420 RepID=UPI004063DDE8
MIWGTNEEDEGKETVEKTHDQLKWSNEGVIILLNGIIQFMTKGSNLPWKDLPTFHRFIQESINFNITQTQMSDKMRRLKWKFKKIRTENEGKDPVFKKAHENETYKLSKRLWGDEHED